MKLIFWMRGKILEYNKNKALRDCRQLPYQRMYLLMPL
jgi:hypothetical protein